MRDTVAICGTNAITRVLIDWNMDADYWFFNESPSGSDVQKEDGSYGWVHGHRVDGVFQMHTPAIWRNPNNITHPGHYAWLQTPHDFPIWMQEQYPDAPASVRYPREEITRALLANLVTEKGDAIEYYTSSAAYAIALAIYRGYKTILLYGVEANSDSEYLRQRAGLAFWIGIAIANGVKVIRQSKSLLLNEPLYGYTGDISLSRDEIGAKLPEYERAAAQKLQTMNANAQKLAGLIGKLNNATSETFKKEFIAQQEIIFDYAMYAGRVQEIKRYLGYIGDAGGHKEHFDMAYAKLTTAAQEQQAKMFEAQGRADHALSALLSVKGQANRSAMHKQFIEAVNVTQKMARDYGVYVGRAQINATFSAVCTERIKAAGGEKALAVLVGAV